MGRPLTLDDDQMTAIQQDLAEQMSVAAISRKYGIPRTTVRDNLERTGFELPGVRTWRPCESGNAGGGR